MNQAASPTLPFDPARHFFADNFVSQFRAIAAEATETGAEARTLVVADASGERRFSFAQLDLRARAYAAAFQQRCPQGARVLLVLENDEHYVQAFLGCLYAGMVAVPVFPPESVRPQHLKRLAGIAADAQAACVVLPEQLRQTCAQAALFGVAELLAAEQVADADAVHWREHTPQPQDIAFLQYTSGSTSAPKGVMVSHGNLMANEAAISACMRVREDDIFVTWLPLYHDMGLIGGLLQGLVRGLKTVLCSPRYFLERPLRWLELVARHRGTVSGGPDFAYRLCVERIKPAQLQGVDLSSWRVAFCGAEPLRADTFPAFIERFSAAGFSAGAAYPCYGLAEATLIVSGGPPHGAHAAAFDTAELAAGRAVEGGPDDTRLVACGGIAPHHEVRIIEDGRVQQDGVVGEIEVCGPSVTQGYWQRAQESAAAFVERDGRRWLRTGDLGFLRNGQLYIAGRRKDLIIVRGQNVYPQDIERAVEDQVEAVRKGRVAAFAVSTGEGEGIGVAAEISRGMQKLAAPSVIASAIAEAVAQASLEAPHVVILLNPGGLPKTSSGKLQRSACRSGWRNGELDAWAIVEGGELKAGLSDAQGGELLAEPLQGDIETALAAIWQSALKRAVAGRQADFFRSGGSSLAAMQVVAAVVDRWQVEFTPAMLFAAPTLAASAAQIAALLEAGAQAAPLPACVGGQSEFPLTQAQQGLWLTWQLQPDSAAYNLAGVLDLRGELQVEALEDALCDLAARHAALRTIFPLRDGVPVQQVLDIDEARPMLLRSDLRRQPADKRAQAAASALQRFHAQAFRLDSETPLRAMLVQLEPHHFRLGLCIHHIAADGWSLGIILDELTAAYEARCAGAAPSWPALELQPGDYALWQRERSQPGSPEFLRQLDYWRARLEGAPALLPLPTDRPRQAGAHGGEGQHRWRLSAALSDALRKLAVSQGVTLYGAVLALFMLALQRLSGQCDLCVGAPLADRRRRQTQALVAYLINVQVVRTRIDERSDFAALMRQVQQAVQEAQAHQDLPLDALVSALQPERVAGANPLFQVKCTQQQAIATVRRMGGLDMRVELQANAESHFDFSLDFTDADEGIDILLAYAPALFDAETVAGLAGLLQALAQQVVAAPALALADLQAFPPVSAADQVLQPAEDVAACWRRQALAQPDAVALRCGAQLISNAQLLQRVDALAQRLHAAGAGPESRVALYAGRGIDFVCGMLAVLDTGAAYVPLDPQLPAERLGWQLQDSGARWVLHEGQGAPAWLAQAGVPLLSLEAAGAAPASPWTPFPVHPAQAAYLIYTSGSTGRPKGVLVTRGGLANYVAAVLEKLALPAAARSMAMISTVAADLGHTTLYGALCSGRQLHLITHDLAFDPDGFAAYLHEHAVDVLKIVPSHLQALLHAARPEQVLPRHTLVLGGEATGWPLLERIAALQPACRVLNHYGPSETTVGVLAQEAASASRRAAVLPVGSALAGVQAWVLDRQLRRAPVGAVGELYLGGAGLARGYHGRAALTAERFVAHPFASGQRLYRSGDRARYLGDGSIEFLGRIDDQVKIRGHRVEPGEVRQQLLRLAGVADAAVLALPAADDAQRLQLHGFIVCAAGAVADPAGWRATLAADLPDYMLPTLTPVPALPLTANGKLDRQALAGLMAGAMAAPQQQVAQVQQAHQAGAPQGELEHKLAAIWAEVLKLPQVGRDDNFFELGGDSILTLKIVARARKEGLRIAPKAMMEKQTVAAIVAAGAVQGLLAATPAPAVVAAPADIPLTPVQHWFFEQGFATPQHWNQSVLLNAPGLDADVLRRALTLLAQRHESLRLRFVQEGGQWRQRRGPALLPLEIIDGDEPGAIAAAGELVQRSLDLTQGPLMAAAWIRLDAQGKQGRLLLAGHHLVVDGVSWRVLLDDLAGLYHTLQQGGTPAELPPATDLHTWSQALCAHAQRPAVTDQLAYWRRVVDTPEPPLADATANLAGRAADAGFVLDADATARLLALGAHADPAVRVAPQDLLLAVLARVLCDWSGRDSLLFELEGHGREDIPGGLDVSRATGWFTSLYPVRLAPGATSTSIPAALEAVRAQLRTVPANGLGYGLLRYLSGQGQELAQGAQPQITFNYLGHFDHRIEPAGWTLADEYAGAQRAADSRRRCLFEAIARVQQGRLQWQWTYCKDLHAAAEMRALQERLRTELMRWIEALEARAGSDAAYALSPMQAGMFFHSSMNAGDGAYINQLRLDLAGVDEARLEAVWREAVRRHPILRTGFRQQGDAPEQWVAQPVLHWRALDLSDQPPQQQAQLEQLEQIAAAELARGFDLAQPGLMRLVLAKMGEGRHHLIWTRHHLLLDGWSSAQLFAEIVRAYAGEEIAAPTLAYRHYIDWLQARDGAAARDFWRAQLQHLEEPTLLAGALPRPREDASGHAEHLAAISPAQWQALCQAAKAMRITPGTLLQGAWALVLQRCCGQSAVAFGVTVVDRPAELEGIESTLGLFINTLPLAVRLHAAQDCSDWLRALLHQNLAMREFAHAPLYEIQRWSGRAGQALFDSILVLENYPMDEAIGRAADYGLHLSGLRLHEQTSYPLTVVATVQDGLSLRLGYDRSRFGAHQVAQLADWLAQALVTLTTGGARLGDCALGAATQRQQALDWSLNGQRFDGQEPVHRLFEQQASRRPDAIALQADGAHWTYGQLNAAANALARRLQAAGVGPDTVVALLAERSAAMVTALLAVLKAGGAYLPLDPDYPAERLAWMLEDARPACLLSHRGLHRRLALPDTLLLELEDQLPGSQRGDQPQHNPQPPLHGEHLAYVIYTSGSTGRPKGAGNSHRALYNRLRWMQQAYALQEGDAVLQKTPFGFDVSVWEFLWPLMTGARLVMAPPGAHRDPAELAALIREHGVSTLHFVPSMLQAFLASGQAAACTSLRQVICSGEALPAEARDQFFALLPQAALHNLYGPTEAAIDVTHWTCQHGDRGPVPIGQPISGLRAVVLDADLNVLPCGVAGELYLGGIGLARGYLGRPGLTAERFVASPFGQGERLYRTGDLVRWREDGQIDYLGRLDHQVKIRGLRIELGEIEAQLLALDEVEEAVVVAHEHGAGPVLAGYVASRRWQRQDAATLKQALAARLPDYMVPAVLTLLPTLPLNANGKIDRKALPAPRLHSEDFAYAAPQGQAEQRLAQIWQALLGLERVGRFDHFFELGGHSLLAASLVARLRYQGEDSVALPLRLVFAYPRLHEMAACIEGQAAIAAQQLTAAPVPLLQSGQRGQRGAQALLSPAQHRLWLVDRLSGEADAAAYNMSAALMLEGVVDAVLLEQALRLLVARHDILRTGFGEDGEGNPVATLHPFDFSLEQHDLAALPPPQRDLQLDRLRRSHAAARFVLRQPPLLRAALVRLSPQRQVLLLAIHHIVADGWSVALMMDEIAAAYAALQQGRPYAPPPLPLQYADYAAWQVAGAGSRVLEESIAWWRDSLAGVPATPYLPSTRPRPARAAHAGQRLRMHLPAHLRSGVQALARREGVTAYAVLLASFAWLLHQRSGAGDFVVGTDVAGRSHPDLERLVGFFVNVLPLRLRPQALAPRASFAAWLRHCADVAVNAFDHQEPGFDRIVEAAGVPRERRWNPLVQVLFVLQNTPRAALALPGVRAELLEPLENWSKFDLALFVEDHAEAGDAEDGPGWRADWVYADALFDAATVAALGRDWQRLLEQVLASPWTPLDAALPSSPSDTKAEVPSQVLLHEISDMTLTSSSAPAASAAPAGNAAASKLDKLRKLKGSPAIAAETPRAQVKTSFLQAGREFPLVIEPAAAGLDMAEWARRERGYIADMLCKHGGVLFRNFGLRTPADFETFAEAIEPELYGGYGDLPKNEGGKNTYRSTPYPEKEMILFHNESAHMERWPRKQWFFCELPSPVGGATPIVDCREVYRRLPAELAQRFEQKQLLYIRTFTERLDVSWRDFFKTDDRRAVEARLQAAGTQYRWLAGDELQTRTLCPAVITHPQTGEKVFFNQVQLHHIACLDPSVRRDLLAMVGMERMPRHVTYGDGSEIDEQTMALVGQLYEQCAVRFTWQQGDVVMLDNMIAAHARDPYEGPRKIVVAMGAMFERKDLLTPAY
ncbi:amino acid adenylation domain-containing protein/non-ribosomal peptide synthase protein (TIGR01720 family) [Herbaspirillum seropedicae]|uniref:amino acid adenylation domain-containing protein n=1 Tax=Herbaspirillum seropedicae TaxID=964 RepID=UPI003394665A